MQEKSAQNETFFIIERLRAYFQVNNDYQVAYKLGIKQNTISAWKRRNTVDHELLITKCANANLNWLFRGIGNMMVNDLTHTPIIEKIELPPGPCRQCDIRERLIQSQQKTIENLEARIDLQEGLKRKTAG
jgi:hypothetical protein